ncbi:MAG TPA: hypothetical protein VK557_03225 [Pyrinomonadaceae bacterium]|nr:hypothetical protein [Pyrinomonadaceae bacterium]
MDELATNNSRSPGTESEPIQLRIYRFLLLAYPIGFRRDYGRQMMQLFRDCHRDAGAGPHVFGSSRLWFRTLLDLARTAPAEHLEHLRKENAFVRNLRSDALALIGSIAIIAMAFFLLTYGRRHEVSSILIFGYALDALVTTGVVGNLIVFLLVKITRLKPLRIAFWTFLIINAVPALALAFVGGRLSPNFKVGATLLGYVVSFLFWMGAHYLWAQFRNDKPLAVSGTP